jgi:hypothetical protein
LCAELWPFVLYDVCGLHAIVWRGLQTRRLDL